MLLELGDHLALEFDPNVQAEDTHGGGVAGVTASTANLDRLVGRDVFVRGSTFSRVGTPVFERTRTPTARRRAAPRRASKATSTGPPSPVRTTRARAISP